jgi:hypothetical protein
VSSAASFEPFIISLEKVSHSSAEVDKCCVDVTHQGCVDVAHLQPYDIPPISLRRTQLHASRQTAASVTIEKTTANKNFFFVSCFIYPFIHYIVTWSPCRHRDHNCQRQLSSQPEDVACPNEEICPLMIAAAKNHHGYADVIQVGTYSMAGCSEVPAKFELCC